MYFTSNWIIDTDGIQHIKLLFDIASELDTRLLWVEKTLENELIIWQFFVEVDSENTLEDFTHRIEQYIALTAWQPIEEQNVNGWSTPPKFSEGHAFSIWIERMFSIAADNKYLINKMGNKQ